MRKVRVLGIALVMLLVMVLHPVPVHSSDIDGAVSTEETENAGNAENAEDVNLEIASPSAILMEPKTGRILYEQNSHEALRPASVTKIMTILLTMEAVRDGKAALEDMVTISANAAGYGGSTILLEEGEQISLENLVKGMCIASGNDAAIAAAEYVGGSQDGFVDLMNQRAQELGMSDTHFVNPCGLDADGHVTSAHDIAVMSRELINNFPEILEYTSIWHEMMPHNWKSGPGETDMANTNKLINSYEGMKGLKTGFTRLARYSLSAVAERNGLTLIAVVMGAETKEIRSAEICRLMDYGFGTYTMSVMNTDGHAAGDVAVMGGEKDTVPAVIEGDVQYLAKRGETLDMSQLTTEIQWDETLQAPIRVGDPVGQIQYFKDGKVITELRLVSAADLEKAAWKDRIQSLFELWS